ncbi:hypothetical protein BD780_000095 [Clostridium tetanomorphum]|nr:hypothetical protein [Clostridium tetanomorphum]NRS82870.1 hypothetical protein [Clostridium tetanomorphum]NRZ99034.1 hypothetical protein [Clostridium tetanomorphum]
MQQLSPIEARKKHLKKVTWTISILAIILVAGIVTAISYL